MDGDRSSGDPKGDEAAKRNAAAYVGRVVGGRYRVESIVALGGMGAVFRAEHVHMRKRVALKLLHPMTQNLPELVARFERESIVGSHVNHPNVCAATDFGRTDDGAHYLVLEYVPGRTLYELLKEGAMPPPRAAEIARQMAAGLGAAHDLGIYHRDVKPSNVIVSFDAGVEVKLVDFGLAKLPAALFRAGEQVSVTTSGTVFGTVAYMAPELARGMQAVDHRSDLYALGIILFEMLAGRHPFDAASPSMLFRQHRSTAPPAIAERLPGAAVPAALEAIVQKLIAKDPEDRYACAEDVVDALDIASPSELVVPRSRASRSRSIPAPRRSDTGAVFMEPLSSTSSTSSVVADAPPETPDPSDASPPPAASSLGSKSSPSPRARGRILPQALIALAVLGAAGIGLWRLALDAQPKLGARDEVPAAPRESTITGASSPGPTPAPAISASAASDALSVPTPPAAGASSAAVPTSAEIIRLRSVLNEAAAAREAKRGAEALLALGKGAPATFADRDVVANAAAIAVAVELGDRAIADGVFDLLTGAALGSGGPDVLFHVTSFYGGSRGAIRAAALLATPEVLAHATPALRIARDLKNATCKDRAALLDRVATDGDDRVLPVLTPMLTAECSFTAGACCAPFDPRFMAAVARVRERLRR